MTADEQKLKEFLCETGIISRAQFNSLEDQLGSVDSLGEVLVKSGYLSEDEMHRALAKSLGLAFVALDWDDVDDEALMEMPEAFCRAYSIVPFQKEGDVLKLALTDTDTLQEAKKLRLPYSLKGYITDRASIKRGLLRYQKLLKEKHAEGIATQCKVIVPPLSEKEEDIRYSAERLPVEYVVDAVLAHALSQQASDIHLDPRPHGLLVRYRVAGRLYDAMLLPLSAAQSIFARLKLLARMSITTKEPQSGRFKIAREFARHPEQCIIRVATAPVSYGEVGEKVALSVSREKIGRSGYTLESLGMHGRTSDAMYDVLQHDRGLILLNGPQGSGKTTLAYTLLDLLIEPTRNVASLEETIELLLPGVLQVEAPPNDRTPVSSRLRSLLRMDPDVLMVGDGLESTTAPAVVHAANSNTLVLSLTETDSWVAAIEQLESCGIPLTRLAQVVVAGIETRVVRRLCKTHEMRKLSRAETTELEDRGADLPLVLETLKEEGIIDSQTPWKDVMFGSSKPCEDCDDGYDGKIGLQEITPCTRSLSAALESCSQEHIQREAKEARPLSLLEDGMYKAALGLTSIEEVLAATL